MRIVVFSSKPHDVGFLTAANAGGEHALTFLEPRLTLETVPLADGFEAVCPFVNDELDRRVLERLAEGGTRLLTLRSAGYSHVDVPAAAELGMAVAHVPAYSPHAVAEHTVGMILALNRKLHRAYARVREGNFSLEGLMGFDLHGRTVGVIGTGVIGRSFARIMTGFGCRLLAFDPVPSQECIEMGVGYTDLHDLLGRSDVISLHCPLTPATHHLIDTKAIGSMKPGAMLINTSRGGLIDTAAAIDGLKSERIGALGLDVYEEEAGVFFEDLSWRVIQDDVLMRLLTFPNVLVTAHQAFFTHEALSQIAETTLANATAFERGEPLPYAVKA
ncbi:MAG TPA: 2-hydroxyacid dehydrogenase [Actinomycetota bacterium]